MDKDDALLVSVDIGTSTVSVLVAEATPDGPAVLGLGTAPSQGVRKGLITNVESAGQALHKAVAEAEVGASCEIGTVSAALTGGHVEGISSQGVVRVKNGEVSAEDVGEAVAVARAVALPPECEILHVFPRGFLVDGQERDPDPVGASGVRLETSVHAVSVASTALLAVRKCCERAGLYVEAVHYGALAAAEAVLTPEEKELGVVLLDVGAGTTSVAAFARGSVAHTAVLPVGGDNVTNDLAAGLRVPVAEAEKLKQRHGCAETELVNADEMIELPCIGELPAAPLSRRKMSEIIEPRVEEIFELVREQLDFARLLDECGVGVVLTGGGAVLEGMPDVARRVFGLPARLGVPRQVSDAVDPAHAPTYATNVGLVLAQLEDRRRRGPLVEVRHQPAWPTVRERVAGWFRDFF